METRPNLQTKTKTETAAHEKMTLIVSQHYNVSMQKL